jgi:hypothetical protein
MFINTVYDTNHKMNPLKSTGMYHRKHGPVWIGFMVLLRWKQFPKYANTPKKVEEVGKGAIVSEKLMNLMW